MIPLIHGIVQNGGLKEKSPGHASKELGTHLIVRAAQDLCKGGEKASLAVSGSKEKNNYLMSYLSMDSFYSGVFIGKDCEANYTNWAANQGEGCALMDRKGKWHDPW